MTVNGIKITNVEGEGCGTCNIAEALKRSLNTSYYRLMLKLKNGPQDVADAAHEAGIAESFPGVDHTLSEDGKGGPPNNGIVLGQYQTRVLDMASAYATIAASGVYHKPHFVQKVVNAEGQVLFDAAQRGQQRRAAHRQGRRRQRHRRDAADRRLVQRPQPGRRPRRRRAKTGTNQLGDTDANRDAWMVGYTPSLSTAVWVGTVDGTKPLENKWGSPVYGSGLPSDIWKATMDGALEGTDNESFPKPDGDRRLRRCAAGTAAAAVDHDRAAPVGHGDPADAGDRAGHHDSVGPADHRARHAGACPRRGPARSGGRTPGAPPPGAPVPVGARRSPAAGP